MEREKILVFANISEFLTAPKKSSVFEMYKNVNKKFYSLFLIPKLKELRKKNDILVICSDLETQDVINEKGLETKLILEYETKRKISKIEKDVTSILDNSNFSKKIKRLSRFKNTSLFDLAEDSVFSYLVASLEIYFTIEKAIEIEKPDRIISIDKNGVFGSLAEMAANKKGIRVHYPKPVLLYSRIKTSMINKLFPIAVKKLRNKLGSKYSKNLQKESISRNYKRKIVIFAGDSHHANMVIPWAKELNKNHENKVMVIGRSDYKKNYGNNVDFESLEKYKTEKISQSVTKESERLSMVWNQLKKNSEFKKSVTYKDINLWKVMKNYFIILFLFFLPRVFEYFNIMLNIIEIEDPDLIVVLNERNDFGKSATFAGNFKDKKVLWVQHGVMGNIVRKPSIVDKIAVFGNYDKRFLMKNGIEKEKIIITGQPRFDTPLKKKFNKENLCKKLKINPNKKVIVFTTQLDYPTQQCSIREILDSFKEIYGVQLIFKLHARDRPDIPKKLIEEYKVNAKIVKKIDIYEILNICDVVITEDSTSWVDTFVMKKPVITMNLGYHHNPIGGEIAGFAIGVHKKGELKKAIKKALYDNEFRKFLSKKRKEHISEFVYKLDGKSTQRLNDLIEKMSDENK